MLEVNFIFDESGNLESHGQTKTKTAVTGILKDLCPEFTMLRSCALRSRSLFFFILGILFSSNSPPAPPNFCQIHSFRN